jgi:hypothetical protein
VKLRFEIKILLLIISYDMIVKRGCWKGKQYERVEERRR